MTGHLCVNGLCRLEALRPRTAASPPGTRFYQTPERPSCSSLPGTHFLPLRMQAQLESVLSQEVAECRTTQHRLQISSAAVRRKRPVGASRARMSQSGPNLELQRHQHFLERQVQTHLDGGAGPREQQAGRMWGLLTSLGDSTWPHLPQASVPWLSQMSPPQRGPPCCTFFLALSGHHKSTFCPAKSWGPDAFQNSELLKL